MAATMDAKVAEVVNKAVCAQGLPKTAGEARSFLHHWLVTGRGLKVDRWGNYPLSPAKGGEPRRYQLGDKVLRLQWRDSSGTWHNSETGSLIESALNVARMAAESTEVGLSCSAHEDCKSARELGAACAQRRILEQISGKKGARDKAAEKGAARRAAEDLVKNGPGFYVVTRHMGTMGKAFLAEQEKPYASLSEAIEAARSKYATVAQMSLTYLLPVQVVSADGRATAEGRSRTEAVAERRLHVWWQNNLYIGPPADPRQLRFRGMVSGVENRGIRA